MRRIYAPYLGAFSTDTSSELDVLGHDRDAFGMDRTEVRVLEQTHEIRFTGFLESADGSTLETQVGLEVLGYLTHEALEWELADEQLGRLLVTTDLSEGYRAWAVPVGLLDTPC